MKIKITKDIVSSADKSLESFVEGLDYDTSFHRMKTQNIKCGFGLKGICCTLCANGPCRVTPDGQKGVCGADSDEIVARNFLRTVAAGSASYIHIAENAARELRDTGRNKGIIKGEDTLHYIADLFHIEEDDIHKKAELIGEKVLEDLYKPRFEEMELVKYLAYPPRYENWSNLGILPGGSKSEVFDAIVKTSTNLNTDPLDSLLHCLTLGISTGLYGLTLTNHLNDIMLGEPIIHKEDVGFEVVDTDYINIMVTGHQHALLNDLQDRLISPEAKEKAIKAGAKGFKILGTTCVGQDIQLRGQHYREVFAGHCGNNFTTEPLLATGAVDLVVSEFNCTFSGIEPIAEKLGVKLICIDDVAKKKTADYMAYSHEDKIQLSNKIIKEAIISYIGRRKDMDFDFPKNHGAKDSLTGVSERSLEDFLGGSYKPLVELIANGSIKGIVGVVGCSNLMSGGHDVFTVELTKRLIKDNILVLSAGCTSGGLSNAGLMSPEAKDLAGDSLRDICQSLGIPPVLNFGPCLAIGRLELVATEVARLLEVDLPELPLIISAPQWLEEQAIADGCFALALGLPLHVAQPLPILGSPFVVETLTNGLTELTGGRAIINDNVDETVDIFNQIIEEKRQNLGI